MTMTLSRRSKQTPLWSLAFATLAACGGAQATEVPGPTTPVTTPSDQPPTPTPSTPSAPYALHEWGLVDVAANGSAELAAGPGTTASVPAPDPERPPIHVRKPVVYAHLLDGATTQTFSFRADVPSGRIVESWPDAVVSGDHLSWPSVDAVACERARESTRRAAARDLAPSCSSLDGVCEVLDLPRYAASDASCLRIDGAELPHALLFYRADLPRVALPVTATRRPDGTVEVRSDGELANAEIVRIVRSRSTVSIARASIEPSSGTAVLPVPTSTATESIERMALVATVRQLGLSEGEAEAFANAWSAELFGARTGRRDAPALDDVILYYLPESVVARLAPLTITPTPRELHRVWLVRVEILH